MQRQINEQAAELKQKAEVIEDLSQKLNEESAKNGWEIKVL
jgi:hypothetical protein